MLIEDLKRTEHLVYVDTTLVLSDEERQSIKQDLPIDFDRVASRKSEIAEQAYKYLQKLQTPIGSTFSDPTYLHHLNLKK